jgi:lipopolysaccharide biosynthesis glycosyltransferase
LHTSSLNQNSEPVEIVFAANNSFAPYLTVAIRSLISCASEERVYRIHVLHTELTAENQSKIAACAAQNVSIECIDIGGLIERDKLYVNYHFTVEIYYRLFIPEVLLNAPKVLYLDSDIIVMRDVSQLYDIDLEGKILGVVHNFSNNNTWKYIQENLGMQPAEYFNSGVLLMDTVKFREERIKKSCMQLLAGPKYFKMMDQDALNIACKRRVLYLDERWNVAWQHMWHSKGSEYMRGSYRAFYDRIMTAPYILHFTTGEKPWNTPEKPRSEYFWEYARSEDFYEEIIYRNIQDNCKKYVDRKLAEQQETVRKNEIAQLEKKIDDLRREHKKEVKELRDEIDRLKKADEK